MLIEFSVGNYLSFKNKVTLSMVSAAIDEHQDTNTFAFSDKLQLLKTSVIYGANASGKSNLAHAFMFMRKMILNSSKESQANESIPVKPFLLDTTSYLQPSFFEIVFIENGIQYRYGFEITSSEITSEWLFYIPSRKEAKLFDRAGSRIFLGENFKEGKGLEDKTRNNALFLSVAAQFNGETAKLLISWFWKMNALSGLEDDGFMAYSLKKLQDPSFKTKMLHLMQAADLGIHDISMESSLVQSQPQADFLTKQIEASNQSKPLEGKLEIIKLLSAHKKYDELNNVVGIETFDFKNAESEGTKKMLALSAPILDTLQAGKLLVIDEFEAHLHPLLTREIIRLFNSKATNPRGAQIIFSTHDTNLLDRSLLRRDQIWFMEKDSFSSSQLYSLVEYKLDKKMIRKDASFEKQYMIGKYGAIPFLGDFDSLFEAEEES